MLMRQLNCSWQELQDTPEDRLVAWQAIMDGEARARRERAAAAPK